MIEVGQELERISIGGRRYYTNPDRTFTYASVTTVLSSIKNEGLDKWRARVGEKEAARISRVASTKGTVIHSLCESYLQDQDINYDKLMPDTLFRFKKFCGILDRIDDVSAIELQMVSHSLKVAGTVDCIGSFNGKRSIIDFKTSSKPKRIEWIENYFMQASAYSMMWYELTQEPITNIAILISVDGREDDQVFEVDVRNYLPKMKKQIREFYEANPME